MIPLLYILTGVVFYYAAYRLAPFYDENSTTHPASVEAEIIHLFPESGRMAA